MVKGTATSEQRHLQHLLNSEELCHRKPSQLLGRMQQLLGDKVVSTDSSVLRELFLQRLPHNIRMILAGSGDDVNKDMDKLATLADKVLDVSTPLVSAVATLTAVEELRAEIADTSRITTKTVVTTTTTKNHTPFSSSCHYTT